MDPLESQAKHAEYALIGAGPSAICAIPSILKNGVSGDDVIWIDPQFNVGDFGTILSVGSSVPGNTAVEDYQKVIKEIFALFPAFAPPKNQAFEIDQLHPSFVCTLKVAANPMQHITNELRKIVRSLEGKVTNIVSDTERLTLEIMLNDGTRTFIKTKRAILATGSQPKILKLPTMHASVTMIDPTIAFIQTELNEYLRQHPGITTVAVIGSSHSAALATMHCLKAGLTVKQFMNKAYKYATPCVAPDGTKYTQYDNTGLKGDVAKFTQQLLDDIRSGKSEYTNKLKIYIGKDRQEINSLLEQHLVGCSHAVAAIGYQASNTLQVNNQVLSSLSHNNKTTEFDGIKGLFGIGVAFPQQVQAISGEIECAVGVGKFWSTANHPIVREIWRKNSAGA